MADKRDYSNVTITHIMADGSVRGSVEGYITAADQLPLVAQEIIKKILTEEPSDLK